MHTNFNTFYEMFLFPKGGYFSMTEFLNKENVINCIFILLLASVI